MRNCPICYPPLVLRGSPKLVRHKYDNIEAAALNISTFFSFDKGRPSVIGIASLLHDGTFSSIQSSLCRCYSAYNQSEYDGPGFLVIYERAKSYQLHRCSL